MVMLNNGYDVPEYTVSQAMSRLWALESEKDFFSLEALWQKANNPGYRIFIRTNERLQDKGLIRADGSLSVEVQQIVLSAISYQGSLLVINNPVMTFDPAVAFLIRDMTEMDINFGDGACDAEDPGMAVEIEEEEEEEQTASERKSPPHYMRRF